MIQQSREDNGSIDAIMDCAVKAHQDKAGAVYTDELIRFTNLTRERITSWLKDHGFIKPAGNTSRRWVNENYRGIS
jgi:hypothetical protein